MSGYFVMLDVPRELALYVARLLRAERAARGSAHTRSLPRDEHDTNGREP